MNKPKEILVSKNISNILWSIITSILIIIFTIPLLLNGEWNTFLIILLGLFFLGFLSFFIKSCTIKFYEDSLQIGYFPNGNSLSKKLDLKKITSIEVGRFTSYQRPKELTIEYLSSNEKEKKISFGHNFDDKQINFLESKVSDIGVAVKNK